MYNIFKFILFIILLFLLFHYSSRMLEDEFLYFIVQEILEILRAEKTH